METDMIVTLNAGSSSLRCAVFERGGDGLDARLRLGLRGLPDDMIWQRKDIKTGETEEEELDLPGTPDTAQETALAEMTERLLAEIDAARIAAFSHRVVHGGQDFTAPVQVDAEVLTRLAMLSPMAPSHQPHNLAAIRDLAERFPDIPQIACFDTAFHKDLPDVDRVFALPKALADDGLRRYGFHGLSYDYVASALQDIAPGIAQGRVVIAHLGHGASMCALMGGKSVATTMGMTALDGLPMGQRCGALDPGLVLYLIEERGMTPAEVREMLYKRSGLVGLSGIGSDMAALLDSDAADAMAGGGVLHLPVPTRDRFACSRSGRAGRAGFHRRDLVRIPPSFGNGSAQGWAGLGSRLTIRPMTTARSRISPKSGKVAAYMIPTDEEHVLARGAQKLLLKTAN